MDANQNRGSEKSADQASDSLLDEAEALIWALLDDDIEPTNIRRLESLLQENEQVRQRYTRCAQLHTDLHQHFGETPVPRIPDSLPPSPVLGQLGDLLPGTIQLPPVAE